MDPIVLCPECWSAASVERWRADQKAVVCATCGRETAPGELVLERCVQQLRTPPPWARRSHFKGTAVYALSGRSVGSLAGSLLWLLFVSAFMAAGVAWLGYAVVHNKVNSFLLLWLGVVTFVFGIVVWRVAAVLSGRLTIRVLDTELHIFRGYFPLRRCHILRRADLVRIQRDRRGLCITMPAGEIYLATEFPVQRIEFLHALLSKLRVQPGPCPHCFYDLTGIPAGSPCPECGKGLSS